MASAARKDVTENARRGFDLIDITGDFLNEVSVGGGNRQWQEVAARERTRPPARRARPIFDNKKIFCWEYLSTGEH